MPKTRAQKVETAEGGRGASIATGTGGGGGMTRLGACLPSTVRLAVIGSIGISRSTVSSRPTIMISVPPRRTTEPISSTARPVIGTPSSSVPFVLPRSTTDSASGLGTSLR